MKKQYSVWAGVSLLAVLYTSAVWAQPEGLTGGRYAKNVEDDFMQGCLKYDNLTQKDCACLLEEISSRVDEQAFFLAQDTLAAQKKYPESFENVLAEVLPSCGLDKAR